MNGHVGSSRRATQGCVAILAHCVALALSMLAPEQAAAQLAASTSTADVGSPVTPRNETAVASVPSVYWHDDWQRVGVWEAAATVGLLGTAFVLRFAGPPPPDNWRGGILFDDAVLRAIRSDDPAIAQGLGAASDVLFYSAMGYRLIDSTLVPWLGYGDADLALQMSLIDLSAFAVQATLLWGSQAVIGRTRPIVLRCEDDGSLPAERCSVPSRLGERRSFIAGHAATTVTAAGLTCIHHSHLPLYGGWGDAAACAAMLTAATFTGFSRVIIEDHYPSDLILGVAVGGFSGWILPSLLHYGFGDRSGDDSSSAATDSNGGAPNRTGAAPVLALPYVQAHQLGAVLLGVF